MRKIVFTVIISLVVAGIYAQDKKSSEIVSLDEIIETESHLTSRRDNTSHYKSVWGKTTFLNLSYSRATLSSSEFPTVGGVYSDSFDNDFGFGLQYGKTFNFHKKPIGTFLFIGLDYTGIDLNVNYYPTEDASPTYARGMAKPYCLPWHNEKWTLDYGMSLGPSLTMYPFTAIGKSGTDNIRLQAYFHVGYHVGMALIQKVQTYPKDESTQVTWGNGLFTSFGGNLTWDFIGVGCEVRRALDYTFRPIGDSFKTGNFKGKQMTTRIYLQFRF